jgi:hypothetical protein
MNGWANSFNPHRLRSLCLVQLVVLLLRQLDTRTKHTGDTFGGGGRHVQARDTLGGILRASWRR